MAFLLETRQNKRTSFPFNKKHWHICIPPTLILKKNTTPNHWGFWFWWFKNPLLKKYEGKFGKCMPSHLKDVEPPQWFVVLWVDIWQTFSKFTRGLRLLGLFSTLQSFGSLRTWELLGFFETKTTTWVSFGGDFHDWIAQSKTHNCGKKLSTPSTSCWKNHS